MPLFRIMLEGSLRQHGDAGEGAGEDQVAGNEKRKKGHGELRARKAKLSLTVNADTQGLVARPVGSGEAAVEAGGFVCYAGALDPYGLAPAA